MVLSIRQIRAFSLVEVAISLGIMSFVLIGVFGLFSVSMRSSRESSEDIAMALATENVMSELSRQGYRSLRTNAIYQDDQPDFYYDHEGRDITTDTSKANQRVYSCTVSVITPPVSYYQPPVSGDGSLKFLRLNFVWPVGAANPRSRPVITGIANDE